MNPRRFKATSQDPERWSDALTVPRLQTAIAAQKPFDPETGTDPEKPIDAPMPNESPTPTARETPRRAARSVLGSRVSRTRLTNSIDGWANFEVSWSGCRLIVRGKIESTQCVG
jgi:hypothetical protein